MTNINGVLTRVFVSSMDAAIPLLLAGNTAAYRDRVATILVEQLGPIITAIENAGGQIVEGPSTAPNGARLIARHPDGSVFEYIENGRAPNRRSEHLKRASLPSTTNSCHCDGRTLLASGRRRDAAELAHRTE